MAIKHSVTVSSGQRGLAVEWNADHVIDGNVLCEQYQHIEHVLENRTDWPAGPVEGQIIQRTDEHYTYVWNGTEWLNITVGGTKDFFVPAVEYSGTADNKGFFSTILCALNEAGILTTRLPHDFNSLVEAKIAFIPNEIVGQIQFDVFIAYVAVGEAFNAHDDDLIVIENAPVRNEVMELDFTAVLAGIAAGDYLGIIIANLTDTDVHVLGMRIRYI